MVKWYVRKQQKRPAIPNVMDKTVLILNNSIYMYQKDVHEVSVIFMRINL